MVSREDAESNARLMGALFGSAEEAADAAEHDQSVSSHLKVHRDEDGDLVQLRFVYVDEVDCIGCTYCAGVARNTFFMEEEAGRARAFLQGGDDPEASASITYYIIIYYVRDDPKASASVTRRACAGDLSSPRIAPLPAPPGDRGGDRVLSRQLHQLRRL